MEAFGPENCIGTYTNTKVKGMVPFDMAKCATNPQLATDLIEMVYPTAVLICAGFTWVSPLARPPTSPPTSPPTH